MKLGTALLLLVIGAVALGGGWYYGARNPATAPTQTNVGQLMFPGLAPDLQQAAFISILHSGKTLVLERHGDVWGVQDRGDYPVQPAKVHALLAELTELRLAEQRTADPAELPRLGLEDPHAPTASSSLLRVLDTKVQPIVEVVVGHKRVRTGGDLPEQVYVRRPTENQSWLAEGRLDADADPQSWFDRDVVSIDQSRIKSVDVIRGEQHMAFTGADGKLTMTAPEEHPKLDDDKIADIAHGLEFLSFTDVKPVAQMPGATLGHAVFATTDGITLAIEVKQAGDDVWLHLTASGSTPDAKKLDDKLKGWAYQVGTYKTKALVPTLDDLAAAPPPGTAVPGAVPTDPPALAQPAVPEPAVPAPAK